MNVRRAILSLGVLLAIATAGVVCTTLACLRSVGNLQVTAHRAWIGTIRPGDGALYLCQDEPPAVGRLIRLAPSRIAELGGSTRGPEGETDSRGKEGEPVCAVTWLATVTCGRSFGVQVDAVATVAIEVRASQAAPMEYSVGSLCIGWPWPALRCDVVSNGITDRFSHALLLPDWMPQVALSGYGVLSHWAPVLPNEVLVKGSLCDIVLAMGLLGMGILSVRVVRRSRRRRLGLCVGCGYDLSGVSGKCPECGREAAIQSGGGP